MSWRASNPHPGLRAFPGHPRQAVHSPWWVPELQSELGLGHGSYQPHVVRAPRERAADRTAEGTGKPTQLLGCEEGTSELGAAAHGGWGPCKWGEQPRAERQGSSLLEHKKDHSEPFSKAHCQGLASQAPWGAARPMGTLKTFCESQPLKQVCLKKSPPSHLFYGA